MTGDGNIVDTRGMVRRAVDKLVDTLIERKSEAIWMGAATAITNGVHYLWNWWSTSDLDAWWIAYVHGLQHCQ